MLALDFHSPAAAIAVIDPAWAYRHADGPAEAALALTGAEVRRSVIPEVLGPTLAGNKVCVRLRGRDGQKTLDLILEPTAAEALGAAFIRATIITADDYLDVVGTN